MTQRDENCIKDSQRITNLKEELDKFSIVWDELKNKVSNKPFYWGLGSLIVVFVSLFAITITSQFIVFGKVSDSQIDIIESFTKVRLELKGVSTEQRHLNETVQEMKKEISGVRNGHLKNENLPDGF